MTKLRVGIFIILWGLSGLAATDNIHTNDKTLAIGLSQRAQEELGYSSGFFITDLSVSNLMTDYLEIGVRFRFMTSYGPATVFNFASTTSQSDSSSTNGIDRPILRARQLVYGNFSNGRWFTAELGLPFFNTTGFASELYRYWSGHLAIHELITDRVLSPYFEVGATVRSLTQFQQPNNLGLSYPPTLEGIAGVQKTIYHVHLALDFRFEQALTETTTAGSFDNLKHPPSGASTRLQYGADAGYEFNERWQFFLRYAQRIFRWPDNDSAALWSTFDEASLGRSVELQWRGEW